MKNNFGKFKPPYLFFDIGGTKMRICVSYDGKHLEPPTIVPTPQKYNEGIDSFESIAKALIDDKQVSVIVGGIAGSLDRTKSVVFQAPHLPQWSGQNLKMEITNRLHAPVLLENDTALVGLGEATFGAGKGYQIVAYVTLSTGVNGVRIVEGKIDQNIFGFEIGHQIINFDVKTDFVEYGRGELEDYIAGSAIEKRLGQKPAEIDDPRFWAKVTHALAVGLHNTIVHWSPELVIIGGAITTRIDINKLSEEVKSLLTIFPEVPQIEKSRLGELGGLYGCLAYLAS